jgi:hypothetical protein
MPSSEFKKNFIGILTGKIYKTVAWQFIGDD